MTGLCGWFDPTETPPADRTVATRMAAALTRVGAARARIASGRGGALAVAGTADGSDLHSDADCLAAVWGRLHFSDRELATLAQHRGAAYALARGYALRGEKLLERLGGSFALAVLDRASGNALLAIDRMGAHPLYYASDRGRLLFGSTLDAIGAFPGTYDEIDRQAIYDYVYFHVVPGPETIYARRERLLPGTYVTRRNGTWEAAAYWRMRFTEDERRPFRHLQGRFVSLLRESVADCARGGRVGAFLSGGTDSSTVAGLLTEVTGEPARTYSIGFAEEGFDEIDYARVAARHFGTRHREHYVTPEDIVRAIPVIAAVHDQPFGNSSAVPTYYCARLAQDDGIDVLLGGDGGDELFGGNSRYAKQYVYSLYSDLPHPLRKGLIEPVAFALPGSVIGKVQRYIRNASEPMPARYDNYNLVRYLGAGQVFTPEFLATVVPQAPMQAMSAAYRNAQARSLINRMLALDLKYTLADNDLPKVRLSCEAAGVEARFPMLDDAVVAFSARLAPDLKLRRLRLRHFFKRALREYLPEEILRKRKHGFGLPFGRWVQTHPGLRAVALDSLSDLKKRDVIRPAFLDTLMSEHVQTHSDYFGTLVWVLMMLEQWFKRGAYASESPAELACQAQAGASR